MKHLLSLIVATELITANLHLPPEHVFSFVLFFPKFQILLLIFSGHRAYYGEFAITTWAQEEPNVYE